MTSKAIAQIWRPIHAAPWVIAETAVRFPLSATIVGLIGWAAIGSAGWLEYAVLAGLLTVAVGPDVLTRTSSLVRAVKSSYRRTAIRLTWAPTMHRAKLFETVTIEDALHSAGHRPGGRKVPKLKRWGRNRIRRTPCGLVLTVDGSNIGAGTEAFKGDQAGVLRSRWKALDLIVSPHPLRPYLTQLRVIFVDPFADVILPSQLPPPPYPPTGVCVVGKDSDGLPVRKDVRLATLIAGGLGSGKSSECWMILWSLCKQRLPFRTRVYDPKGGQEFFNLADKAYRYESNATLWCEFLEQALAAMGAQQASLKAAGKRKWEPGHEQWPLDVMIIDELVTVIAMMAGAENKVTINGKKVPALKAFLVYLSQCRAAGFTVIACSQLTQKEAIGLIRDLFAYITCLRVGSDDMVRTILGDPKMYPAHLIPPGDANAGIGYTSTPRGPLKYRAAYLDDDDRDGVADAIGVWSKKYRDAAKHTKGTPIVLDLGDDDLEADETEHALMAELVHICQKCGDDFVPQNDLALNGASY